jgi:hypothetical protein
METEMVATRSKSDVIVRDRKAIAGIETHYGSAPAIVLGGESYAPSDVVKVFQDHLDALDAAAAAKAAFHVAIAAQEAAGAKAKALFQSLKVRALSDFANQADVLAAMGISLPKRRAPSVDTRATAKAKAKATRDARHTMGKRQKANIKGTVPSTTPTPPTQG